MDFNHFGFGWEQFGRFIMKFGQLLRRAQVGFAGDQYVANADLVFNTKPVARNRD